MSAKDTISLAHTARCKLMIAADQPDRNLRFILGHAFTLDKLRLRVLEIETENGGLEDDSELSTLNAERPRRVSFPNNSRSHTTTRNRSPPPGGKAQFDSSSSDDGYEEDDEEEDEEADDGLSLRRFTSATAQPPRMIEDEDSDGEDENENEPVSPPPLPTDMELQTITEGPESEDLAGLYQHVKGCPCSAEHQNAPGITRAWELPQKPGYEGKRLAVVEVAA
ncbi:hypothetical protein GLAREA_05551 [Glarea lozoyensis ATCC 20868]|uniref:Uncharacterized protein n=1 Tax=Glarea lozoyensis (strain ATCC 20868 / MF5171) TaxID=1116229 RepID=S3ED42_GLAL2|nr:uncharacterized protein GLAREA_05551 [Glarea lozoyensis ATCC 20868]EPE36213.1 hypothetical protein GLAREA_05551 [Glarea lozoyensis ATCC 20868]